jgi:hypothetical protein
MRMSALGFMVLTPYLSTLGVHDSLHLRLHHNIHRAEWKPGSAVLPVKRRCLADQTKARKIGIAGALRM